MFICSMSLRLSEFFCILLKMIFIMKFMFSASVLAQYKLNLTKECYLDFIFCLFMPQALLKAKNCYAILTAHYYEVGLFCKRYEYGIDIFSRLSYIWNFPARLNCHKVTQFCSKLHFMPASLNPAHFHSMHEPIF
ncbi:hypothetical protein T12_215 [Trichinella patagoniensis]|uniref:Uncharacterized protein n=1 Tax=Trichinella patagoniensis TaxID=990121 RepID=A0A0V0ZDD0_9BILA|nr:hypothetical protein T12_215 [Trichinella patagoniensis]